MNKTKEEEHSLSLSSSYYLCLLFVSHARARAKICNNFFLKINRLRSY